MIIGSGAAGLQAAVKASEYGSVILLTKSSLKASSSSWAQGGIAAVLNTWDSFQSHKQDTLDAGRGLCNPEAVDILVEEGALCVRELIDNDMPFDRSNGSLDLGLEGGHSNRRVLHANGAATGEALVDFLVGQVQSKSNIRIIEHAFVFELLKDGGRAAGAEAYQYKQEELLAVRSKVTILATGGYSGLYQRSTNPHTSTGDGLWLGYNAGARLQDLEFVQFHPTAFYDEHGSTFLISEALRGEGAYLLNEKGERFLDDYPQKELAPRDVVSKEIFAQIQNSVSGCVYLDVRHLAADDLRNHFPGLMQRISERGIDIAVDRIPVAPAAHYCIGGIATDLDARTSVEGLYACGEVAATGVHGANRLASNSLLECLVFSARAVNHAVDHNSAHQPEINGTDFHIDCGREKRFSQVQKRVAQILSEKVGLVRSESSVRAARNEFEDLLNENEEEGSDKEYYKLRIGGLLEISRLITKSALERTESRGVHTRTDFPQTGFAKDHISFTKESQQVTMAAE